MSDKPEATPPPPPSIERQRKLFNAHYRWLIRQELGSHLPTEAREQLAEPSALSEVYDQASAILFEEVVERGEDPTQTRRSMLASVAISTRALAAVLQRNE